MNIVLEGPDNSGKSTLAQLLARELGRKVFASEGPERYSGELRERVERYRELSDVIFDRHPCVSDIIYSRFREQPSPLASEAQSIFYAEQPLLIYCDPLDRGLKGHIEKTHDSADHIKLVHQRYDQILELYRVWAIHRAHVIYRIGDDPQPILRFCRNFDPVADVRAFHNRFNRQYEGPPRALPQEMQQFGERFLRQEMQEYIDNAEALRAMLDDWQDEKLPPNREAVTSRLAEMQDGLIDLVYVALGRANWHGFNFYEGWRRVHNANMTKRLALKRSESERGSLLDIIKPENFQKPRHDDLVENHIHKV